MKCIFTLILLSYNFSVSAQWGNTSNDFYDSLHTPVCTAAGEQLNSIIVKSYPDSGYFVIWEDHRRGINQNLQIFAQKYDKMGKQLWATDGIPISGGTNSQHFTFPSNNDYRNYSVAGTDSLGGFYLGYADDSVSVYVWERLTVQHVKSDGSLVFPVNGSILLTSDQANQHLAPQLVADGSRGFFVSYLRGGYGTMDLYVYCYKDINGILKRYGGGLVNANGAEIINTGNCGNYTTVVYPQTYVLDYKIYPDQQNGCNVVFTFSQNGYLPNNSERLRLGFNWLWKAKKDAVTSRGNFSKDSVAVFYNINVDNTTISCKDEFTQIVHTYNSSKLTSLGYLPISDWLYDAQHSKGVLVQTEGNINVNIYAINQRNINGNAATDWFTRAFYRKQQKFDGIPYEYTVEPFLPNSFTSVSIPNQNTLGSYSDKFADTLLYNSGTTSFYDFSLASGGENIFATGVIGNGSKKVFLQQLQVKKITADSLAIQIKTTSKNGILIGKETSTGFSGTNISYNNPQVAVDNNGNGVFYIMELGRSTRVSPIVADCQLAWGAMGKPTGSGHFNGYYDPDLPYMVADPLNGSALLSWNDSRTPPSTGNNIYMRHLDNLNVADYVPPYNLVKQLINPYGATTANPATLLGSSKKFTTIDAYSGYSGHDVTTPVVEILDAINLGSVTVSVYENVGPIRKYNGSPYLDRNYTITPEINPAGTVPIPVRLFFTQAEFDALKLADPSITSPADLVVIKQPATGSAPASFIFVAGQQMVVPQSWSAVPGGFYIEIAINSFSNFFIESSKGALPVTWLRIQAEWTSKNLANVTWQVAQEINVRDYTVQQSSDGINFMDVCNVKAENATRYHCTVSSDESITHYYRVLQTDIDSRNSRSKIVALNGTQAESVSIYPNPVTDEMQVTGLQNFTEFTIMNMEGKIINKQKISGLSQSLSVNYLQSGAYLLKLKGKSGSQSLKFIKK